MIAIYVHKIMCINRPFLYIMRVTHAQKQIDKTYMAARAVTTELTVKTACVQWSPFIYGTYFISQNICSIMHLVETVLVTSSRNHHKACIEKEHHQCLCDKIHDGWIDVIKQKKNFDFHKTVHIDRGRRLCDISSSVL